MVGDVAAAGSFAVWLDGASGGHSCSGGACTLWPLLSALPGQPMQLPAGSHAGWWSACMQVLNSSSWAYQRLTSAGAVLVAKLATGELAWGDTWWVAWGRVCVCVWVGCVCHVSIAQGSQPPDVSSACLSAVESSQALQAVAVLLPLPQQCWLATHQWRCYCMAACTVRISCMCGVPAASATSHCLPGCRYGGQTHNPWDVSQGSCGSSGGSASVVVASGGQAGLGETAVSSDRMRCIRTQQTCLCVCLCLGPVPSRLQARSLRLHLSQTSLLT